MDNKLPCDRHGEQIKTLFKKDESMERRIEKLENDREFMHSLDKTMALQTKMLEDISAHNKKQDIKLDEMQQINLKINENLTELAEGQRTLNKRVGKLEDRVDENEEKHTIDIRPINKKKYEDVLYKIIIPGGIGIIFVLELIKYFK